MIAPFHAQCCRRARFTVTAPSSVSRTARPRIDTRRKGYRSCRGSLPDHRHEAVTDTFPVFRVSGQIPQEDSLLVEEPPEQEGHHGGEREEAPVRAERERGAEHVERPLAYIGWRTTAYGPVATTFWPAATSIVAAVKVFAR